MSLFKLRLELRAIRHAIEELRTAIQSHSETVHAAQEAQQQADKSRKPTPVVVSYDDKTVKNTKCENNRQYRTQNSIKNWTKIAVIAASIYAGIAFLQWLKMSESNRISRESLESVQRAFVSFQHFDFGRAPNADGTHTWHTGAAYENNGTTPAIHVIGMLAIDALPAEPTSELFTGKYALSPAIGIPPKGIRSISSTNTISESKIFGLDLGQKWTPDSVKKAQLSHDLFIWGWMYYRDVFKTTAPT